MTLVRQRTGRDCGVTALALLLVDVAMRHVDPTMRGLNALFSRELVAAAKVFGVRLTQTRRFDLDTDQGILRIRWNEAPQKAANPYGHFVTVLNGCIHCPCHHVVMPWRDYLVQFKARACTLLRERR